MNSLFIKKIREELPLFEKNKELFWTDPHISKQMLKAHLDNSVEGASRNHSYIKESAGWISRLMKNPGGKALLDLGCGPGLYGEEFSQLGFRVTGVDFSKRSIDYAKSHTKNGTYLCEDYLNLNLKEQFDVITLIYCDYGALTPEDRRKLLEVIDAHLKPGGYLVMDCFTKMQFEERKEETKISLHEGGFWNKAFYCLVEKYRSFSQEQVWAEQFIVLTENKLHTYYLYNTAFDPKRLEKEITELKNYELSYFSDVRGNEYTSQSKTICVVAKKEKEIAGI